MELNKIYFGDCLDLMATILDGSVDLIAADLPYGTTQCSWDTVIPFEPLWKHYKRILKPNGTIVLTSSQPFTSALVMSNPKMFRYDIVWDKVKGTGFLNAKKRPMRNHESILVFYKKLGTYNPQKTTGHKRKVSSASHKRNSKQTENYGEHGLTSYDSTERYPRSIQIFSSDVQKSSLNPTQKPVALFEWLIKTYSNVGDTVLDNCAGSCTTAIACIKTNRNYICIENDAEQFRLGTERIENHLRL